MRAPRLVVVIVFVLGLLGLGRTSSAFDTTWHDAASDGAAKQHGFTDDAAEVLQFGTFGPDFFGPVYTYVDEIVQALQDTWAVFKKLRESVPAVVTAGDYLHFDNIDAAIDRDWKYDYLFRRLLDNTQTAIKGFASDSSVNEDRRKLLVLLTLGASLHAIEDFYSHSNWVHFDFVKLGFPQQQSVWKQDCAPSWFQVVTKLGPPAFPGTETWPIEPRTGVYKPKKPFTLTDSFGTSMDHDIMNHDNSQLTTGGVAPPAGTHDHGPHPAKDGDAASATAHQLYAINTAAMAAIEWVSLVEQDAAAKSAIDSARTVKIVEPRSMNVGSLTSALAYVLMLSCATSHWDGKSPPTTRASQCRAMNYVAPVFSGVMAAPYWSAFLKDGILQKLTAGVGDASGHYTFDETWYKAHRPPDTAKTKVIQLAPLNLQINAPKDTTVKSSNATTVVLTSPQFGELDIEVAQPQPPPPPPPPDPPPPPPADPQNYELIYRIPSTKTFKVVGQRTFGARTFSCGGTGTNAQANAMVTACNSLNAPGS